MDSDQLASSEASWFGSMLFSIKSLEVWDTGLQSKEEGKDQESIQSSTTSDPRHHIGKWQKLKKASHTREPWG